MADDDPNYLDNAALSSYAQQPQQPLDISAAANQPAAQQQPQQKKSLSDFLARNDLGTQLLAGVSQARPYLTPQIQAAPFQPIVPSFLNRR